MVYLLKQEHVLADTIPHPHSLQTPSKDIRALQSHYMPTGVSLDFTHLHDNTQHIFFIL